MVIYYYQKIYPKQFEMRGDNYWKSSDFRKTVYTVTEHTLSDRFPTTKELKEVIRSSIISDEKEFIKFIKSENRTAEEWVYAQIINNIYDQIETGKYHVKQGEMNEEGEYLFKLYVDCYDKLCNINPIDVSDKYRKEQIEMLRKIVVKVR